MSEVSETKERFLKFKGLISKFFPLVHISNDVAWDMFISSGGLKKLTAEEMSNKIDELMDNLNNYGNESV